MGARFHATAQVSVGATSTAVVAARPTRRSVTITNLGTVDVYLSSAAATTTGGDLLPGVKGASKTYDHKAALNGIVASGTQGVSVSESYD